MKTTDLPPSAFIEALKEQGKNTPENWRDLPEWKMYRAGYNAAVADANNRTRARYAMPVRRALVAGLTPRRRNSA